MPFYPIKSVFLLSILILTGCQPQTPESPSSDLALIINEADPLSKQIGEYYRQKRQIPAQNVIKIKFDPHRSVLPPKEFEQLKEKIDRQTPASVQGYALTWARPYRVGCLSITTAVAMGFDPDYCAKGCQLTKFNPYFNQSSDQPFTDFGIRPTMAIAATTFPQAKALIDRGVASDGTSPLKTAYLVNTTDKHRNARSIFYPSIAQQLAAQFDIKIIKGNHLSNRSDVMFYFTGLANVSHLESNRFLPGAVGDHLTSFGGKLTDSPQMSSLRWLEAGATGSYGTVVEPCNFTEKFPHPGLLMAYYLGGDRLLDAYWKSVAMPGQGIFIGEPLAQPFKIEKTQ